MISFDEFVHKATSNIKAYDVLEKIGLDSEVGTFLRDGDFFNKLWYSQSTS